MPGAGVELGDPAAQRAAEYGAKVAIVEPAPLGGTCVNLGCIPKKLLSYAAHYAEDLEDARGYGWTVEMQVRALRLGMRVTEVPVRYRRRAAGQSKISGTLAGTLGAGWKILYTIARHAVR